MPSVDTLLFPKLFGSLVAILRLRKDRRTKLNPDNEIRTHETHSRVDHSVIMSQSEWPTSWPLGHQDSILRLSDS